jgi:hypothetical protein
MTPFAATLVDFRFSRFPFAEIASHDFFAAAARLPSRPPKAAR